MKIVDAGQYAQFDKYTDRNIFEQYYKKNEQGVIKCNALTLRKLISTESSKGWTSNRKPKSKF